MPQTSLVIAAVATAVLSSPSAFAQADAQKLGAVHFEISCNPQAQTLFDRAMLYQHSFWYRASQRGFEEVLKADPECAMAYWGIRAKSARQSLQSDAGEKPA